MVAGQEAGPQDGIEARRSYRRVTALLRKGPVVICIASPTVSRFQIHRDPLSLWSAALI